MYQTSFKAVLFDLDDTLIDRKSAYEYMCRRFYDLHNEINSSITWVEARNFFWNLSPNNAANITDHIKQINKRWPTIPNEPEAHKKFYFEKMIENIKPLPGVNKFIKKLKRSHVKWGVVTNGDDYQYKKIAKIGWTILVPFVLASDIYGVKKPQPEIYKEAVRLLDIKITDYSKILFVGDNLYTDIIGAQNVGMKTAWVRMGRDHPTEPPIPDIVIDHVDELTKTLRIE